LLPLDRIVVAGAISGLMDFIERSRAQKLVMLREDPFVMAEIPVGRIEVLVVRAAGEAGQHIVNHAVAIDKSAVEIVAQVWAGLPKAQCSSGEQR